MSKLLLLLLISCATNAPTKMSSDSNLSRRPASIFMDEFQVPGGKAKLNKIIDDYAAYVAVKILAAKDPNVAWFKSCGKVAPKKFTAKEAFECHDKFAVKYFMDINFITIASTLDESDTNTIFNQFGMYPIAVVNHYRKIADKLPE